MSSNTPSPDPMCRSCGLRPRSGESRYCAVCEANGMASIDRLMTRALDDVIAKTRQKIDRNLNDAFGRVCE
jgi:hypothetical protein